jgi:hypothetical protein
VPPALQALRSVARFRLSWSDLRPQLTARTHQKIAIVALANKLARMAWAVLANNEVYRPPLLAGTATTSDWPSDGAWKNARLGNR